MIVHPPSTKTLAPVMYEEASEAIKVTTFATITKTIYIYHQQLFIFFIKNLF